MKESQIVGPEKKRELLACEKRIKDAGRDVISGHASIGIELKRIHDEELFLASHTTWNAYVEEKWETSPRRAYELMALGERWIPITEKAKDNGLPYPDNEWQIRPLLKLEPHIAGDAWVSAAKKAKEERVQLSQRYVEPFALEFTTEKAPEKKAKDVPPAAPSAKTEDKPTSWTAPVKVDEINFEEEEPPKDIARDDRLERYSTKAQETIERVGNVISPAAKESILDGTLKISDKDLQNWGTYDGGDFVGLGKYLIEQRWPLGKSKKFLFQAIDLKTKTETLINLALAKGGTARVKVNGFTIDIYRDKDADKK